MDLLIKEVILVDPETGRWEEGNAGIEGGKIAYLGKGSPAARQVIDGGGKTLVPGFIDIHMHVEPLEEELARPQPEFFTLGCMARMGVTTAIGGNCGLGTPRVKDYLDLIDAWGAPVNFGLFVGYSAVREALDLTDHYAPAPADALPRARELLGQALADGAVGISLGLEYTPGAPTEELIAAAGVAADYPGAFLAAHYRYDASRALEAIEEMITIGAETGLPMQVSHIGSCAAFGNMAEALERLERAREAGQDVSADCYPYEAFCTFIGSPVFDPGCLENWGRDYDALQVGSGPYAGQRCDEKLFHHLRREAPDTLIIAFVMDQEEVLGALRHPLVMVASDALYRDRLGHPRGAGTFPRVLGPFVREEENFLSFTEALAKMTILPARRLGLEEKGRLQEGADADLVLLDPAALQDRATFAQPTLAPEGIQLVLVGGELVVSAGKLLPARPGRPLYRRAL
ncbi:MAG: amidohydrolase family protein [bacterium]|mgnify:CR=1 FL=1|jgi:N-acyl-D-amino-acid deacylase|nr:amidohydrolase family protein [Bacillota bacterium]